MSDGFYSLCEIITEKSERILELSIRINRLECNERQPLELFALKKEYNELKASYDIDRKKQNQIINNFNDKLKN